MKARPDILLAHAREAWDRLDDEELLVEALASRGLQAVHAVWSNPDVDWNAARMVVVRYAFDYTQNRDRFLAWAESVESVTTLHNPTGVLRWNSHKSYLRELESDGIPVVPTQWIDAGASADLSHIIDSRGWREVVVKPAIDNGARRARRVSRDLAADAQVHLDEVLAQRDAMIQPFIAATEDIGEHALIHFDGRFSHAIRKDQMLAGRPFSFDRTPLVEPDADERSLAARILDRFDPPLLYARVDTIVVDGEALLMELEVLEPVLFFSKATGSAARMAAAITARL